MAKNYLGTSFRYRICLAFKGDNHYENREIAISSLFGRAFHEMFNLITSKLNLLFKNDYMK